MQVKDIPQELIDKINEQFEQNPKIQQLRVRQQMLVREHKFADALDLAKNIESLRNSAVYEYMKESERQLESVDVSDMDIPLDDKERMMQLLLVCFMCADIIESSVIDMDDILHRYDKSLCIEMFNDIRQVMNMSKEKLKYLQQNSGYMKDLVWADKCDDLYDMAKSKAGSIMRKRKSDPNWGRNAEKLNVENK